MKTALGIIMMITAICIGQTDESLTSLKRPTTLVERLKKVKVPRFQVDDLSVEDTFTVLKKRTKELDAEGLGFNILYKCNKEKKRQIISLDLSAVPVSDLIYFICLQSGLNFRIEQHAVIVWEIQKKEKMNKY